MLYSSFIMADITSQSGQMRTKLGDIVEHSSTSLNEATEVTKGLRNVVGWLKQVERFELCFFSKNILNILKAKTPLSVLYNLYFVF